MAETQRSNCNYRSSPSSSFEKDRLEPGPLASGIRIFALGRHVIDFRVIIGVEGHQMKSQSCLLDDVVATWKEKTSGQERPSNADCSGSNGFSGGRFEFRRSRVGLAICPLPKKASSSGCENDKGHRTATAKKVRDERRISVVT